MAMQTRPVNVMCRKCGRPALSTEFVLDPVYKMMVCKKCVEERRIKENPIKSASSVSKSPQTGSSRPTLPPGVPQPVIRPFNETNPPIRNQPTRVEVQRTQPIHVSTARSRTEPVVFHSRNDINPQPKGPSIKTKQKCKKCGYSYTYDPERMYPKNCPNCGTPSKGDYDFF